MLVDEWVNSQSLFLTHYPNENQFSTATLPQKLIHAKLLMDANRVMF